MAENQTIAFCGFANYLLSAPHVAQIILKYLDASDAAMCIRTCKLLRCVIKSALTGRHLRNLDKKVAGAVCKSGAWKTTAIESISPALDLELSHRKKPYYASCRGNWIILAFVTNFPGHDNTNLAICIKNYMTGKSFSFTNLDHHFFKPSAYGPFLLFSAFTVKKLTVPLLDTEIPQMEELYKYSEKDREYHRMFPKSLLKDIKENHVQVVKFQNGYLEKIAMKLDENLQLAEDAIVMELKADIMPLKIIKSKVWS